MGTQKRWSKMIKVTKTFWQIVFLKNIFLIQGNGNYHKSSLNMLLPYMWAFLMGKKTTHDYKSGYKIVITSKLF